MDSKNVLLSATFFLALSLVGCQTVKSDPMLPASDASQQVKQATWKTKGETFNLPDNSALTSKESRIVFFQQADTEDANAINISIGTDNVFQTTLQNGQYSDVVICSGPQIIHVGNLNQKSGEVLTHSESYQFTPQATTYLQVALSTAGNPVIRQIAADKALPLLNQSTRQIHQISRVLSDCNATSELQQPLDTAQVAQKTEIKNPPQFNILFDFDSADINKNHAATLAGMANFIKSYPRAAITVEGHTDNKGPESYNLKLSQSRADTVKNILVDQYDIEAPRLSAIGYGETMPIDTNDTKQGRQNNRRVVAIVNKENN